MAECTACVSALKYLLFLYNLIFVILGLAIIAIGVYVSFFLEPYAEFLLNNDDDKLLSAAGYTLMGVGALMTVVYFLGCCGACSESTCMLYSFSALVVVLILAEIGVAIYLFAFTEHAREIVKAGLKESLANYNKSKRGEKLDYGWDRIQDDFDCCGIDNYTDWKNATFYKNQTIWIPVACCKDDTSCLKDMVNDEVGVNKTIPNINQGGCYEVFEAWVESKVVVAGSIAIGVAVLHLIITIMACFVGRKSGSKKNTNWHSRLSMKVVDPL